jgi:hypothetical protein
MYESLFPEHPLTALVLSNLSSGGTVPVKSMIAEGKASLFGGDDFRYKLSVAADESLLVLRYVFEPVEKGPLPEPIQVELDIWGAVITSPLSPHDAKQVLESASSACGTTETP